ncbi:MAG: SMC-Scp complex subunit ScpB [Patescibacteria group bacterium]
MTKLTQQLEALLFISPRPLAVKKLAAATAAKPAEVVAALEELATSYQGRGLVLKHVGENYQLMTAPTTTAVAQEFVKEEMTGELTKPSLETLTVIAYRGPVSKPELELIRGVNCSLILRNLLIRGLIEEISDKQRGRRYQITMDFLKFLGVSSPSELPKYQELNAAEMLQQLLAATTATEISDVV